ncbi:hypothetical protein [Adhaeribacter soli]|jgi:hypothetical protein|uniref:hypothetical protein n=1 Tax=Adhaeribacter soli TaxID=2607655 RepID=UPI00177B1804|nr:hypothetical protein [Adhaeribacter soli]
MKKKKILLADELKFVNRLKWGFEQAVTTPKKLQKPGAVACECIEIYNFGDYTFSDN